MIIIDTVFGFVMGFIFTLMLGAWIVHTTYVPMIMVVLITVLYIVVRITP